MEKRKSGLARFRSHLKFLRSTPVKPTSLRAFHALHPWGFALTQNRKEDGLRHVVVICLFSWCALMGGWGEDMMRGKGANEVILIVLGIMQGRVVSVVLFC
jgi:hypothetical protein